MITKEVLNELLVHPRLRVMIQHIAQEKAEQVIAAKIQEMERIFHKRRSPRIIPAEKGDVNYAGAAVILGCPQNSVRYYVYQKRLVRGKLPYTVTLKSCWEFKRNYTKRPGARKPEKR